MKKSIILFFMTCSVACVPIMNDEIVYFHGGGNLNKTLIEVNNRNSKGSKVEIRGTCVSSCTTYLAVKNHCVSPTVVLGFHGTTYWGPPITGTDIDGISDPDVYLAQTYPPNFEKRFWKEFRHDRGMFSKIHWLTGRQLKALEPEHVKPCVN
ncbi:MAG: hypothetical protein ACON45_04145 [Paracoccaceae bacterium]